MKPDELFYSHKESKISVDISPPKWPSGGTRSSCWLADVPWLMKFSPKLNVLFVAHLEPLHQHAEQSNFKHCYFVCNIIRTNNRWTYSTVYKPGSTALPDNSAATLEPQMRPIIKVIKYHSINQTSCKNCRQMTTNLNLNLQLANGY